MALVKFIETTSDKLDSLPISDGSFIFTTDDKKLYRDASEERALVSGTAYATIEMDTESSTLTIEAAQTV